MALEDYQDEPVQLAQADPRSYREALAREQYLKNHEIAVAKEQERRKKLSDFQASPEGQRYLQQEAEQRQLQQVLQSNPKLQQQFLLEREKARLRPQPERAPIQVKDESGNVKLVDWKGNLVKDLGSVGQPSAAFQKERAAKAKVTQDLSSIIPTLTELSKDGGLIDQSTGSGAGAMVDAAAGFFGKATPGAIAVGKLKPMVDPILKLVPRFEGPQSDKDTQSYREAAGDLANPSTPNKTKKAAAKTILDIFIRRKEQFSTSSYEAERTPEYAGPERRALDEPPPGAVRRRR